MKTNLTEYFTDPLIFLTRHIITFVTLAYKLSPSSIIVAILDWFTRRRQVSCPLLRILYVANKKIEEKAVNVKVDLLHAIKLKSTCRSCTIRPAQPVCYMAGARFYVWPQARLHFTFYVRLIFKTINI